MGNPLSDDWDPLATGFKLSLPQLKWIETIHSEEVQYERIEEIQDHGTSEEEEEEEEKGLEQNQQKGRRPSWCECSLIGSCLFYTG